MGIPRKHAIRRHCKVFINVCGPNRCAFYLIRVRHRLARFQVHMRTLKGRSTLQNAHNLPESVDIKFDFSKTLMWEGGVKSISSK